MKEKTLPRWAQIWVQGWMIYLSYIGVFVLFVTAVTSLALMFDSLGWPLGWAVAVSDLWPRIGQLLADAGLLWSMWPFAIGVLTIGNWIQEMIPKAVRTGSEDAR